MLAFMSAAALLAAAAVALARSLPAQNAALILCFLIACEIVLEFFWAGSGLRWRGLIFWPAAVVLARAGIRWMLRRRQAGNYGIRLIVLASAAAALAQFAIALSGEKWTQAVKFSAIRFGSTAFCLFWLSPWFISKFAQQPQEHAQ